MESTRKSNGVKIEIRGQGDPSSVIIDRQYHLTALQVKVLEWIANGKRNSEIAEFLDMKRGAVQAHARRIMNLTGTSSRAGMVAFALRRSIIK